MRSSLKTLYTVNAQWGAPKRWTSGFHQTGDGMFFYIGLAENPEASPLKPIEMNGGGGGGGEFWALTWGCGLNQSSPEKEPR